MTDEELIVLCMDIIRTYSEPTQENHDISLGLFNKLYLIAENTFQQLCIQAAYYKMWRPDIKTIVSIFE